MKKLAIIITHPIQYYVPLFQLLAQQCDLKVFYTWGEKGAGTRYDPDFKQTVTWDIPLLEGYSYEFLNNIAEAPGSHHFTGIKNPDLIHAIKQFNPDALLIYGWAYQSHLKIIRYFKGRIPVWFRGDSTLIQEANGLKTKIRKLFLTWVYKHIDKALYVGKANKAYFEKMGLKPQQLVFVPHAIDNRRFQQERKSEALQLRAALSLKETDILILFAGKLEWKKNPELLLQAMLELNLPDVHVLYVGSGELEEKLKDKSKRQKAPTIHFLPFQNQSQMPVVYQACDVFCLPSQGPGETWGLAVNEAMAAGKAILVSDAVGAAQDLVSDQNGVIFKSNNLSSLKEKLVSLTSNKSLLLQKGLKSKEIIQNWSIEAQSSAILKELNP